MIVVKQTTQRITGAQIKSAAQQHRLDKLLSSGDRIPIVLKNGEVVTLIIGYDKNRAYFCFEDCLKRTQPMSAANTNTGGWKDTDIRHWLNTELFSKLPDELQEIIVPTRIVQVLDDGERVETEDKVFLLSRTQMFGIGLWSDVEPEDTQIDIFTVQKNRVKRCGDKGAWWYGLRSPQRGSDKKFASVNSSGAADRGSADRNRGISPCFCVS